MPVSHCRNAMTSRVEAVALAVADHYGYSLTELLSTWRTKSISEARAIAMWIARKRFGLSFPELGREFGRDHSTAIAAVRRIEKADGVTRKTRDELLDRSRMGRPRWSNATGARELDWA